MVTQNDEAKAIYQGLLDDIIACYQTEDFDRFQQLVYVPHHFRTARETFVLRDFKDLESMFQRYIVHFKEMKMTDHFRTCLGATFKTKGRIQGEHETQMLSGTEVICPTFKSTTVLMLIRDKWMVCASQTHLSSESLQGKCLREALAASTAKFDDALTIPPRPLEPHND